MLFSRLPRARYIPSTTIPQKQALSDHARSPSARLTGLQSLDAPQKPPIPPYPTIQTYTLPNFRSQTLKSHGVTTHDIKVSKFGEFGEDTDSIKSRLFAVLAQDFQSPNLPHWAWSVTNGFAQYNSGISWVNLRFQYPPHCTINCNFHKTKNKPLTVIVRHRVHVVHHHGIDKYTILPLIISKWPVLASNQRDPTSETFLQQISRYNEIFETKVRESQDLFYEETLRNLSLSCIQQISQARDYSRSSDIEKITALLSTAMEGLHFPEDVINSSVRLSAFDTKNDDQSSESQVFQYLSGRSCQQANYDPKHRVFIAFGSNLGDRVGTIEAAAKEMMDQGLIVKRFSAIYETPPMYKLDQPSFLNAVCEIETDFKPLQVLDQLQKIENSLGRVRMEENGPRTLDLDILMYDNERVSTERLIVPHKLMLEREFVLRPLCNLIPNIRLPQPFDSRALISYLNTLTSKQPGGPRMLPVTCLSPRLALQKNLDPKRSTLTMAILNITPDSFSDGGLLNPNDLSQIETAAIKAVTAGAQIIDIGGQSTRPGASLVSAVEELDRILPAIKHIRSLSEMDRTAISVDTFYSSVAEQAINAGADIINDVSGGKRDPSMFKIAAQLNVSIILMHSRGDPSDMATLNSYPRGVVTEVADELAETVQLAEDAGVRPWRIILDPGIGFAKDQSQNLELIREFHTLRHDHRLERYAWLIGSSRKGFIGKITGASKGSERAWGTAATVTASIKGGADIVRVHDVAEMGQVAKMADALFRVPTAEGGTAGGISPQVEGLEEGAGE